MGPMESSVPDKASAPCKLIKPRVVFKPVIPFSAAGMRTEPPVSEPSAAGHKAAATATPEPLEEPPGVRWVLRSQGFQGVPITGFVPQPPNANSTMWVLPKFTMPARSKRSTAVQVVGLRRVTQSCEPPVVIWPSMSQRSLTAIGTPSTALRL